jgi:hypothetical protein
VTPCILKGIAILVKMLREDLRQYSRRQCYQLENPGHDYMKDNLAR